MLVMDIASFLESQYIRVLSLQTERISERLGLLIITRSTYVTLGLETRFCMTNS